MKITDYLKREHADIRSEIGNLAGRLESDGHVTRSATQEAARALIERLQHHEGVEDKILYRFLIDRGAVPPEVLGIFQDGHRKVHSSLGKFEESLETGGGPLRYAAGTEFLEVLREHFEEEEKTLFPWVEKQFSSEDLEDLGLKAAGAGVE